MLLNGLILMIIGMLTVFVFLLIMVIVMFISAKVVKFIGKFMPEVEETRESSITRAVETHEDIAIVLAAVKQFSNN